MEFKYTITPKNGHSVISLEGNLIEKNQTLRLLEETDELIQQGRNKVLLDLNELNYINSTGLNVLINLLSKARKSGGEAVIINVNDRVKKLFLITKLNTVFTIAETEAEAIESLK